nr:hypothetical protein CFP56_11670 [Quercus suber]
MDDASARIKRSRPYNLVQANQLRQVTLLSKISQEPASIPHCSKDIRCRNAYSWNQGRKGVNELGTSVITHDHDIT